MLETKPREVELSVTKSDDGHWAAYITELVNLRNLKPVEHRWLANTGPVTRITLPPLEPGTPYRVRVRPVQYFTEPNIWIDEATFNTRGEHTTSVGLFFSRNYSGERPYSNIFPGNRWLSFWRHAHRSMRSVISLIFFSLGITVELKIDHIQERQAVLSVVTSNSTGWSNYTVKITPPKGREETTTSHQISGKVTEIDLPRLDVYTKYIVRVAPVLDDGTRLREWANEVSFETLPSKLPRCSLIMEWTLLIRISFNLYTCGKPCVPFAFSEFQGINLFLLDSERAVLTADIFQQNFLYIAAYPSFTKEPPSSIFLIPGENVSIQCNASGIPQPVVKWIRRSSPPPNGRQHDTGGVLKISNALPRDSGDYECVASNKRGVIRANTMRLVVPRPGKSHVFNCREMNRVNHGLTWRAEWKLAIK